MADTPKTPPTGTPAVLPPPSRLPTVATVQLQAEINTGLLKATRKDLDEVIRDVASIKKHLIGDPNDVRFSPVPSAPSAPITIKPTPSIAVRAAKGTPKIARILFIATGALTFAGQVVALWKPEYTGPIFQALKLLGSLGGGGGEP